MPRIFLGLHQKLRAHLPQSTTLHIFFQQQIKVGKPMAPWKKVTKRSSSGLSSFFHQWIYKKRHYQILKKWGRVGGNVKGYAICNRWLALRMPGKTSPLGFLWMCACSQDTSGWGEVSEWWEGQRKFIPRLTAAVVMSCGSPRDSKNVVEVGLCLVTVFKNCKQRSNSELQWKKGKSSVYQLINKVVELSKPHSQIYGICKKQLESERC